MEGYPGVSHVPNSDSHRPWLEYLFWPSELSLNPDETVFRDFMLHYFEADREIAGSLQRISSFSENSALTDGCRLPEC